MSGLALAALIAPGAAVAQSSPVPDAPDIVVLGQPLPLPPGVPAYGAEVIDRTRLTGDASGRVEDVLADVAGFQQFRRADSRSANPSAQGVTLRALGGNASSRALLLLDGVPLADPFFGYIPFNALAADRLSGVRVTRGGGAGAFGAGAVAGTIELASATRRDLPPVSGEVFYGSNSAVEASGSVSPDVGSGFVSLSGKVERGDGFFTTPFAQRTAASARARYRDWSGSVRAVVPLDPETEVQASGLLFRDNRTLRFAGADSSSQGEDASVRLIHRGGWAVDALAYVQARNFTNRVISATTARLTLDQRNTPATGIGGKIELRPPIGPDHLLRIGVDARFGEGTLYEDAYAASGAVTTRRTAGGRTSTTGLFVEDDWTIGRLVLTAGGRVDRWTISNGFFREASASGRVMTDTRFANREGVEGTGRAGALFQASGSMAGGESRMFKKILVANRGEIACRVMRTAKKMGIATVAVYSDADARSPHVLMADESVRLGPPPAGESYLLADLILLAAKETGADCIHPGYGFLSERESFAKACAEAGIAFVGPPPAAIAAMGDKIESKKLAKQAGVNVVPGFLGEIADTEDAVRIASEIGYPVMMKASAGGGGKGMRLAYSEQDVREGFEATKREGLASFGDDRVFIEKFIESPRHIEIQVMGDQHGNIVYLGERECSIQRRHQKVVEEAPSPFVTPKMRKAMGEQAVALARAVGYYSAGTVELIVSGADTTGEGFYFLEMNTRLQVEHPVTEAVTGLDLVELMIRVAYGEPLGFGQDDVRLNGWAVENRVYAEDPYRGFLPSIGRLVRYNPPESKSTPYTSPSPSGEGLGEGLSAGAARETSPPPTPPLKGRGEAYVRVDDGVREGGEVSMFYDPMIAKLITWAPTREEAIDEQIAALDAFEIEGPGNNLDFLSALMQHPRFRSGNITTGFIAEEYPDGFHGAPASPELSEALAAIAAFAATAEADRARRIDGQLGKRLRPPSDWSVKIGEQEHLVAISTTGITVDDADLDIALEYTPGDRVVEAELDDAPLTVKIARTLTGFKLTTRGASHVARVLPAHVAPYAQHLIEKIPPDLSKFLLCPMPGLLMRLDVAAGDKVEAGQPLAVVEAMKMENILRAEKAGTVKSINAKTGDSLAVDAVILEME